jgi:hypothetical protein
VCARRHVVLRGPCHELSTTCGRHRDVFVIIAITIPILGWVSSVDGDRRTFAILFAALLIRLLASLARYYILAVTYGGVGDAGRYHYGAIAMANHIKDGSYEIDLGPRLANNPPETRRIGFVTGLIYPSPASVYSGYFVFTWFAFLDSWHRSAFGSPSPRATTGCTRCS